MAVRAVVTDQSFDITLSGFDMVWALRRRLSVPISKVRTARVITRDAAKAQVRWRLGGTYVPRVVCAGRYSLRDGPGRAFASIYKDGEVLEVTTRLDQSRVILLQHPDRHDLAWYLGERIG